MPGKPQHRITQPGPLHDERGRLAQRGYATSLLLQYDRSRVAASPLRIKEWDYYYIGNASFGLALTIDDNGYMSLDSISLLDFDAKWEQTTSRMGFMPLGRRKLPATSARGDIDVSGRGYEMHFKNDGLRRSLYGSMQNFRSTDAISFDITLTDAPRDSMVIVTPRMKRRSTIIKRSTAFEPRGGRSSPGGSICFPPQRPLRCLIGGAACGPMKTPGTGAQPPASRRGGVSASTSATALAIPARPVRTWYLWTASRTSYRR